MKTKEITCVICGKKFVVPSRRPRKTCSKECRLESFHRTCLENLGYEHPAKSKDILTRASKKRASTFQERYGCSYPLQVQKFLDKAKTTFTEHYGVDNPMKSPEIMQKSIETCESRYGVRRPTQAAQFKKTKQSKGRKSRATVKQSD